MKAAREYYAARSKEELKTLFDREAIGSIVKNTKTALLLIDALPEGDTKIKIAEAANIPNVEVGDFKKEINRGFLGRTWHVLEKGSSEDKAKITLTGITLAVGVSFGLLAAGAAAPAVGIASVAGASLGCAFGVARAIQKNRRRSREGRKTHYMKDLLTHSIGVAIAGAAVVGLSTAAILAAAPVVAGIGLSAPVIGAMTGAVIGATNGAVIGYAKDGLSGAFLGFGSGAALGAAAGAASGAIATAALASTILKAPIASLTSKAFGEVTGLTALGIGLGIPAAVTSILPGATYFEKARSRWSKKTEPVRKCNVLSREEEKNMKRQRSTAQGESSRSATGRPSPSCRHPTKDSPLGSNYKNGFDIHS